MTLKEELDNLKNYISIQQFRFPKKFKIHFGPMESLQEIGIPKLSLQPLVENAIIHGLKDTTLGGEIHIEAKKMGNILEICVSDNGTGMNLEKLDRLRAVSYTHLDVYKRQGPCHPDDRHHNQCYGGPGRRGKQQTA